MPKGVVHGLDRRARQLELAARLERDGAAAGHVEQPDDGVALHDRLPAEQHPHAVEQRANAAPTLVGHGLMPADREREFLVLGADAELRLRPHPGCEPGDELVARLDRRHVDLIACHAGSEPKGRELTLRLAASAMPDIGSPPITCANQ
jgi:hypothetical protein